MLSTGICAALIHHYKAQKIHGIAGQPSLTMHDTSMSWLMDNFLAPQYISVKHLTFIDMAHYNILSNEGLHQFNTWLVSSKACIEQVKLCLFMLPGLAYFWMN